VGNESLEPSPKVFDTCPHCGQRLSPWQQVLLGVDRALMCRNCWYRIILDVSDEAEPAKPPRKDKPSQKK
jgi:hypothetical protein